MDDSSRHSPPPSRSTSVDSRGDEFDAEASKQKEEDTEVKLSDDEESLVIRMYNLVGDRWHLIAGRIPGRTALEIEQYWNSRCGASKRDAAEVNEA
ncbi:Transcription factor CPC [Linum perenne]